MYSFIVTLGLLIASIISVNIPMPISDSGFLTVNLIEIILPFIALYLFIKLLKKQYVINQNLLLLLKIIILFILGYSFIFMLRLLNGNEYKQSLLTVKVVILPIIILFFYDYHKFSFKNAIYAFVFFDFFINLKMFFNLANLRMLMFLGNILVPISIIILLLPINFYIILSSSFSDKKIIKVLSSLNIVMSIIYPILVGSRVPAFTTILSIILCIIWGIKEKSKKIRYTVSITIFSFCILSTLWFTNFRGLATYMYRIVPPTSVVNQTPEIKDISKNTFIVTMEEKSKSDSSRFSLWQRSIQSIVEDPIIGEGTIYFTLPETSGIAQPAHNFILEYINSFGIPLTFFVSLIYLYLISIIYKKRECNRLCKLISGTAFINLLGISLFQPTFMIVSIMMILWIFISVIFNYNIY